MSCEFFASLFLIYISIVFNRKISSFRRKFPFDYRLIIGSSDCRLFCHHFCWSLFLTISCSITFASLFSPNNSRFWIKNFHSHASLFVNCNTYSLTFAFDAFLCKQGWGFRGFFISIDFLLISRYLFSRFLFESTFNVCLSFTCLMFASLLLCLFA